MVELFVIVVNQQANAFEDGATTRITLPEKPLTLVTVMIVCLSEPTGIAWKVGLSVIVKSTGVEPVTVTAMIAVCEIEPLDPFIATTYVPRGVEDAVDTTNVEVAVPPLDRLTLVVLKVTVKPTGEEESVRFTVPVNPLRLVRVMVADVPDVPAAMLRLDGLAVIVKSGVFEVTITNTVTEWDRAPLAPVTAAV
jgi:hypothetical protein